MAARVASAAFCPPQLPHNDLQCPQPRATANPTLFEIPEKTIKAKTRDKFGKSLPIIGGDIMWSVYHKDYPPWPLEERKEANLSLQKSHFNTTNDIRITQNDQKSIYRKDYPAYDSLKTPASKPPLPAPLMHADHRIAERLAETAKEYTPKSIDKTVPMDPKLRQSNFKLGDTDKIRAFNTTHRNDFPIKSAGLIEPFVKDRFGSSLSFGDKAKADLPISEFKDRYRDLPFDATQPATAFKGPPVIRGDDRVHDFNTVHRMTYKPSLSEIAKPIPNTKESSIVHGDPNKINHKLTEMQTEFIKHDVGDRSTYSKTNLQATHWHQSDGREQILDTTFRADYVPKTGQRESLAIERNKDSIPRGDTNPLRPIDTTNYKIYHQPLPYSKRDPVKNAEERTESQVVFGKPELGDRYFHTTHRNDFEPPAADAKPAKANLKPWSSAVPLQPFGDFFGSTITGTDFTDPQQGRMKLNMDAIAKLRNTTFKQPLTDMEYATEYRDQYFGKESNKIHAADKDRLQRSSVPIGTLTQN